MRTAAALAGALLLSAAAFRVALVGAPLDQRPIDPDKLWPSHPAVKIDRAMALVGAAARQGQAIPDDARRLLRDAAARDLMAPEPYLVEGARAEMDGKGAAAERLFAAARARDPRSGAARYFLAGRYLSTGRLDAGLAEMSAMIRMVEGAGPQFVPALVAFARQPGSGPALRRFFRESPAFEAPVLGGLATDPANADLILSLATLRPGQPPQGWESALVNRLVDAGQPEKAKAVWARLVGAKPNQGIFNPSFRPLDVPGPFSWSYDSSGAGLVTPQPGSGLELVYYGRQDVDLAQQMLALAPGSYRLESQVRGTDGAGALAWVLECIPGATRLAQVPLGTASGLITVPAAGCALQRLRLHAKAGDVEQSTTLTVSVVRMTRVAAR